MKAVEGQQLEINKETPGAVINSVIFSQLAADYRDKELPKGIAQAKVRKNHSRAVTCQPCLLQWINPRREPCLPKDT